MTPTSGCSPSNHLRTDICSSASCGGSTNGQQYSKGVSSCTTVPIYLPRQIPNASGNAWYQIAEMKDNSSYGGDWTFYIASGGVSRLSIGFSGGAYSNTDAYEGSAVSAGIWHTISICSNNNNTVYGIWFDGNRLTFNVGSCAGSQTCSGLNLFYDGFAKQPLDINAYTGNTSGSDPWAGYTVIHGDPLIATIGSNGLPPEPSGGWNSP
jgi:hypothetical protein